MNAAEKNRLSLEAKQQIQALKRISWWRTLAIALSTVGVALAYAGFAGAQRQFFCGILGLLLFLLGAGCALILNLGLKNGRRNVEKILNLLDKE